MNWTSHTSAAAFIKVGEAFVAVDEIEAVEYLGPPDHAPHVLVTTRGGRTYAEDGITVAQFILRLQGREDDEGAHHA